MKLDLKKFKHISSDKNSTKLRHEDGHFLVLANKAFKDKDVQAQLAALASAPAKSDTSKLGKIAIDAQDVQDKKGYKDGGEIDGAPASANNGKYPPQSGGHDSYAAPATEKQTDGTVKPTDTRSTADKVREAGHNFKQATGATYGNYAFGDMVKGTQEQADDNERKRGQEAATKVNPQMPQNSVDVRTDDQKARAVEAAKAYGYADGGDVPQVVPDYTRPPVQVDPLPVEQQGLPSDVQQTREIYNRLASNVNPHGMTKPITSLQFGPNGEEPTEFNPKIAQQAQLEHSEEKADNAANIAGQQQATIQDNQARTAMGLQPLPVPNVPDGQQVPGSPTGQQPIDPSNINSMLPKQQDPMAQGMDAQSDLLSKGYKNQLVGINQGAAAQGKLGEQQAALMDQNIKAQTDAQAAYQQHYNDLEQERQAHMQDIQNGHIDPEQYWTGDKNGNGSHSRIASAIGMILAGFDPAGRANSAVDLLKYNMDRNIDAQKTNLSSDQNLLAANLRQFGNLRDATDMTKLMQADIMHNELTSAAAKAQSPMAKAAALQAAGQLQMQYAPLQQQMAMRRAMMNLANNGGTPGSVEHMLQYMRMTNPEQAKEMEARYVPGVGLASVPVPADVRNQMVMKQQFSKAVTNMRDWASQHSGSVSPTDIATGKTMAANVQNLYREAINGGVFKAGEQNFINKIIDNDPTKFFNNIRVLPKLDEALRENENSLNVLKKSNGLPVQQTTNASQQQPQYKTVNGIKYMRGPDGKAVPVK